MQEKIFRNPQLEILERDNEPRIICGATDCVHNSGASRDIVHHCTKSRPLHISCMISCDDYKERS